MRVEDIFKLTEEQEECLRCQKCCTYNAYFIHPDSVHYYKTRGHKVYHDSNNDFSVIIHDPCQHLCELGCRIYHLKSRPEMCKTYHCKNDFRMKGISKKGGTAIEDTQHC